MVTLVLLLRWIGELAYMGATTIIIRVLFKLHMHIKGEVTKLHQ